jgi:hypothetical protein
MDLRTADTASALLAAYDVTARTTESVTPALDELGLTMNTAYALWMVDPDVDALPMKELAARMHRTRRSSTGSLSSVGSWSGSRTSRIAGSVSSPCRRAGAPSERR